MATITWKNAVSADWSVAGQWSNGLVPGAADDAILSVAGSYIVTLAESDARSLHGLRVSAGDLRVLGALTLAAAAVIDTGGLLDGGSTIAARGLLSGSTPSASLLNHGTIYADTANGTLQIDSPTFTSDGFAGAANGAILFITANSFTNLAGNVLTGGTWEVDGNSAIDFAPGPYDFGLNQFPNSTVTDNEATITLNGPGSAIFGYDPTNNPASAYDDLETSLLTNGTLGTLNIIGGRDFISANTLTNRGVIALAGGTFSAAALPNQAGAVIVGHGTITPQVANAGTIEAQLGTLTLAGGVTGAGLLRTDAGATLRLSGTYGQSVLNDGTVAVAAGTLRLSGALTGAGGFFVNANTTLDLATASGGGVAFNGTGGVLKLENPASFSGAITGFGAGDTIDLAGLVANGVTLSGNALLVTNGATVVDSIALAGSYAGATFTAAPDGTGGTRITASGINPRHFAFEGPVWASHTITWSLATFSYSSSFDTAHPFTHSIDPGTQAAEVAVIQQAFARWQAVANLTFVQVADNADPAQAADIRVGWGNLINGGGGEIGQAAYQFIGAHFTTDSIVRLEDPAITALDSSPGVIGGLVYHGFSSTLYQVAVHEIGHALGLDHSTDSHAVMFPTAQGVTNQDANASDIAGIQALYGAGAACYAAGTMIATAAGEVAIEALRVGDLLPTLSGGLRPLRWLGWRTVDCAAHPRPESVWPIRVRAGAFGPGAPHSDLLLSPDHAVHVRVDRADRLVPIRLLANGTSIRQERMDRVTYWHVELDRHDVVIANGLGGESYLDTGNRHAFSNGGPVVAVHPDFANQVWVAHAFAPQLTGGPGLAALQARLDAIAARLPSPARGRGRGSGRRG